MKYAIFLLLLITGTFSFCQGTRGGSHSAVLQVVDHMPEYPGGNEAMTKFINDNIQYPDYERENKIQGQVVLEFIVGTDGTISNIGIRKSVDQAIDQEAIRVVKLMPNFNPGTLRGEQVRSGLMLSIVFGMNGISAGPSDIATDAVSQYKKACSYIRDQNYEVAKNYLEQEVEEHYPPALTQLGLLYMHGKGVSVDYSTSMKYFSEAADSGYATAQLEIGRMYEKGEGVEIDSSTALVWYRKAATQGSVIAQNRMGTIYKLGTSIVSRDIDEAMRWYDMAARQHNPDALNNYAWLCYIKKENIEKGIEYIKEALEKAPDDFHRLDTYASLLFLQGSYADAEKIEKKAIDGGGDKKAVYLEMYGDIQIKLGNKDDAIRYWKMAQEMDGHSDKLAEKLSTEKYVE